MLLNLVYFINLFLALILPCCPDDWIQSNQTHYRRLSLWEKKHIKWCTTCIQQPTRTMNSLIVLIWVVNMSSSSHMTELNVCCLAFAQQCQCQYKSDKERGIKDLLWKISGHLLKQNHLKGKLTNIQAYFTLALRSQSLKENSKKGDESEGSRYILSEKCSMQQWHPCCSWRPRTLASLCQKVDHRETESYSVSWCSSMSLFVMNA